MSVSLPLTAFLEQKGNGAKEEGTAEALKNRNQVLHLGKI